MKSICLKCGDMLVEHPDSDNIDGSNPNKHHLVCEHCGFECSKDADRCCKCGVVLDEEH